MTTVDTLRLVHAENFTTPWARPPGSFVGDELFYANRIDTLQILDDADSILNHIAIFKMLQICAWKLGTG
jgi:hypothetical protein